MVRVVRPLFGDSASGPILGAVAFRRTRTGFALQKLAQPVDPRTPAQLAMRDEFRQAHAAWVQIPPTVHGFGSSQRIYRVPSWPVFWRAWLNPDPPPPVWSGLYDGSTLYDGTHTFSGPL